MFVYTLYVVALHRFMEFCWGWFVRCLGILGACVIGGLLGEMELSLEVLRFGKSGSSYVIGKMLLTYERRGGRNLGKLMFSHTLCPAHPHLSLI